MCALKGSAIQIGMMACAAESSSSSSAESLGSTAFRPSSTSFGPSQASARMTSPGPSGAGR